MKRLPSQSKQHPLILNIAVNLPTAFMERDVKPKPKSDDATIRDLWFRPDGNATELQFPQ